MMSATPQTVVFQQPHRQETPMIHPTAIISPGANIGTDVEIGPYSVIGDRVSIGDGTRIGPHVVIEGPATIGRNNTFFQFCSIGAIPQDLKFSMEETELIIGDNNTFREFNTINRGTAGGGGKTVIGSNCLLMAYTHVAHDCLLGNGVIMANNATLAGHIRIDDCAIIGGISGIHQFVHIGSYAMIGGLSGVSKDVPPFTLAVGQRAILHGLNLTGLKRHNFSTEVISELKAAYKLLFRSNLHTDEAVSQIHADGLKTQEVRYLVDFIKNSERGVTRE
jgi:UDP-N-acetylglucosamine acyltransferase